MVMVMVGPAARPPPSDNAPNVTVALFLRRTVELLALPLRPNAQLALELKLALLTISTVPRGMMKKPEPKAPLPVRSSVPAMPLGRNWELPCNTMSPAQVAVPLAEQSIMESVAALFPTEKVLVTIIPGAT